MTDYPNADGYALATRAAELAGEGFDAQDEHASDWLSDHADEVTDILRAAIASQHGGDDGLPLIHAVERARELYVAQCAHHYDAAAWDEWCDQRADAEEARADARAEWAQVTT